MTEYDYSPDAIERHIAKQNQIASWVDDTLQHEPANPFMPIPGERPPSEPSEAYYHPPPHPSQLYPQQYQPQYQYQQPYPAFYATPQGVISPTYSGSSKRHHHHQSSKHRHHHSSGSKSLYPSPHTSYAALPSMPMGLTYAPTPQRSVSTPPSMMMMNAGNVYPTTTAQQSYVGYQAMQAPPPGPTYATISMSQGYAVQQPQQRPAFLTPSYSYSTSQTHSSRPSSSNNKKHRSRSHSRSTSYSHPPLQQSQPMYALQSPPLSNGPQILQSPPNQSAYVPINGGGYVIIPPGQKAVIAPMTTYPYASSDQYHYGPQAYNSDSESEHGGSFFGNISLKKFGSSFWGGGGHTTKKSKRRGRRDSF